MNHISWFVNENEEYKEKRIYDLGTMSPEEEVVLDLQVWNNRWGVEDVPRFKTPVLKIQFDHLEDSEILNYIEVSAPGMGEVPMVVENGISSAIIGEELSGKANDGVANDNNSNNYTNLSIKIKITNNRIKEDDLKRMRISLSELS